MKVGEGSTIRSANEPRLCARARGEGRTSPIPCARRERERERESLALWAGELRTLPLPEGRSLAQVNLPLLRGRAGTAPGGCWLFPVLPLGGRSLERRGA